VAVERELGVDIFSEESGRTQREGEERARTPLRSKTAHVLLRLADDKIQSMNKFQKSLLRSSASKKVYLPGLRSGSRWSPRLRAIWTTSERRPMPAPLRSPVEMKTK
jgi:hypothetical protein